PALRGASNGRSVADPPAPVPVPRTFQAVVVWAPPSAPGVRMKSHVRPPLHGRGGSHACKDTSVTPPGDRVASRRRTEALTTMVRTSGWTDRASRKAARVGSGEELRGRVHLTPRGVVDP